MVMKCPPPIPAECVSITPMQKREAIAASTAFPPRSRMFLEEVVGCSEKRIETSPSDVRTYLVVSSNCSFGILSQWRNGWSWPTRETAVVLHKQMEVERSKCDGRDEQREDKNSESDGSHKSTNLHRLFRLDEWLYFVERTVFGRQVVVVGERVVVRIATGIVF